MDISRRRSVLSVMMAAVVVIGLVIKGGRPIVWVYTAVTVGYIAYIIYTTRFRKYERIIVFMAGACVLLGLMIYGLIAVTQ